MMLCRVSTEYFEYMGARAYKVDFGPLISSEPVDLLFFGVGETAIDEASSSRSVSASLKSRFILYICKASFLVSMHDREVRHERQRRQPVGAVGTQVDRLQPDVDVPPPAHPADPPVVAAPSAGHRPLERVVASPVSLDVVRYAPDDLDDDPAEVPRDFVEGDQRRRSGGRWEIGEVARVPEGRRREDVLGDARGLRREGHHERGPVFVDDGAFFLDGPASRVEGSGEVELQRPLGFADAPGVIVERDVPIIN
ncbi:hypothetical protein Pelo_1525 [Pelomyxa schiedti]|nr:hypothetical protein Pelo_1525 [Pelomyxa schiedti]